jgi:hypothetical protein
LDRRRRQVSAGDVDVDRRIVTDGRLDAASRS